MIPTETTSLMFSTGDESFASNNDTATTRVGLTSSSTAHIERREALSERGVGKAAFLVKDAVIGIRWADSQDTLSLNCVQRSERIYQIAPPGMLLMRAISILTRLVLFLK